MPPRPLLDFASADDIGPLEPDIKSDRINAASFSELMETSIAEHVATAEDSLGTILGIVNSSADEGLAALREIAMMKIKTIIEHGELLTQQQLEQIKTLFSRDIAGQITEIHEIEERILILTMRQHHLGEALETMSAFFEQRDVNGKHSKRIDVDALNEKITHLKETLAHFANEIFEARSRIAFLHTQLGIAISPETEMQHIPATQIRDLIARKRTRIDETNHAIKALQGTLQILEQLDPDTRKLFNMTETSIDSAAEEANEKIALARSDREKLFEEIATLGFELLRRNQAEANSEKAAEHTDEAHASDKPHALDGTHTLDEHDQITSFEGADSLATLMNSLFSSGLEAIGPYSLKALEQMIASIPSKLQKGTSPDVIASEFPEQYMLRTKVEQICRTLAAENKMERFRIVTPDQQEAVRAAARSVLLNVEWIPQNALKEAANEVTIDLLRPNETIIAWLNSAEASISDDAKDEAIAFILNNNKLLTLSDDLASCETENEVRSLLHNSSSDRGILRAINELILTTQ